MTYLDRWRAISTRIRGLVEAGRLHADFLNVNDPDPYRRGNYLHEQSSKIVKSLREFRETFRQFLPPAVIAELNVFLDDQFLTGLLRDPDSGRIPGTKDEQRERTWTILVRLAGFETEMSFLLSDAQLFIRARSERAFAHLQRSIVVDLDFRNRWNAAFKKGETECEKLGAVHLLLHGIFAFKIDASGARTDLVFQERIDGVYGNEAEFADGFVLTEWKKASTTGDAKRCFEQARSQARLYAEGPLMATELRGYRYIVVVSDEHTEIPADIETDHVLYRHVNIAVAPRSPSKRARKQT